MGYQILVNQAASLGELIQEVSDSAEFSSMFVVDKRVDEQHLFLYLVSQRDVTSMFKVFPS